ncbi:MAG: LacI family DNA-binding transcriptional regulator [Opitutaceae bacterium]|jgi:LacI family transcriptional regulator
MAEIARRAGVAKSTVSMALRNDPSISEKQRIRIRKIATKMGYKTNALVARLMHELRASKKRRYVATLAFVSAFMKDFGRQSMPSGPADILSGAESRARELGYGLDYFWLREPRITPQRLAKIFQARNVLGAAIFGADEEIDSRLPEYESAWGHIPVLTIGTKSRTLPVNFVCNDYYSTATQGCARLVALGYKRIGLYMVRWLDDTLEHRFVAGYRNCLEHAGMKPHPVFYLEQSRLDLLQSYPDAQPAFSRWLSENRLDAVLAVNSWIFDWLNSLGLRMPEDLGVALLDLPRESIGEVAGMRQRLDWTGMAAVDALVGQIMRHEAGVPAFQKGTTLESSWIDGPTVAQRPPSP